VKDGGILTALDAASGKVLRQGRITGAIDKFFSSPVAADGKIYLASETGKLAVLKAGADWEVLAVNDFAEPAYATPAIADGRLYIRAGSTLYAIGAQ
jgi:outer membrane protein assembly factor BamB